MVAVTAAMLSGTGLTDFQKVFPERCFDVGIAEQHAVTFAGAMARSGLKPVVAVYSTFMQRSHDSIMHDVALQRTGVVLALDRAGIVGADGATHQGIFDMAYLGSVPGIVIGAPKDEFEMEKMLELGLEASVPFVLRYPRANIAKLFDEFPKRSFQTGEGEVMFDGEDVTLLALGSMVEVACKAHALLREKGVSARVVNMRFAKPLDETLILESIRKTRMLFTLEEHVITGGFGAKVLEFLEIRNLRTVALKRLALPNEFIEHGSREKQLDSFGLSPEKVADSVIKELSGQKKCEKSAGLGSSPTCANKGEIILEPNEEIKQGDAGVAGETKEAKFKRLAEQRVAAALDKIRLIGNLASSQYAYNGEQVAKIFSALKGSIEDIEDKFHRTLERKKETFHL